MGKEGDARVKARVFNIMQYEYHPFDAYDEEGNPPSRCQTVADAGADI